MSALPENVRHDLRRASAADLSAIEALQLASYAPNRALLGVEPIPLLWDYAKVLREEEIWLLDASGGTDFPDGKNLAAVVIIKPERDHLLLSSIAIAPDLKGQGFGTKLLAFVDAQARAMGFSQVRLYTDQPLTRNIALYQRRGYVIERVEVMPDRSIVHMKKTLP